MNFPEPRANPFVNLLMRKRLQGHDRVLGEIGLEMLFARMAWNNVPRFFKKGEPSTPFILSIEGRDWPTGPFCETMKEGPKNGTPLGSLGILLNREATGTRHPLEGFGLFDLGFGRGFVSKL